MHHNASMLSPLAGRSVRNSSPFSLWPKLRCTLAERIPSLIVNSSGSRRAFSNWRLIGSERVVRYDCSLATIGVGGTRLPLGRLTGLCGTGEACNGPATALADDGAAINGPVAGRAPDAAGPLMAAP